jgi:hypothetical protein
MKTYDIYFHNETDSNNKGFNYSYDEAVSYVKSNNGTNHSYFEDYKGGIVQVICNETNEVVHETEVV